jgi:hypothetical protein
MIIFCFNNNTTTTGLIIEYDNIWNDPNNTLAVIIFVFIIIIIIIIIIENDYADNFF